jgi:CheY-like chemotaxis protein
VINRSPSPTGLSPLRRISRRRSPSVTRSLFLGSTGASRRFFTSTTVTPSLGSWPGSSTRFGYFAPVDYWSSCSVRLCSTGRSSLDAKSESQNSSSREELLGAAQGSLGSALVKAFDTLDDDADGTLTWEEFLSRWATCFSPPFEEVALLDIGLPVINGYELARHLRRQASVHAGLEARAVVVLSYVDRGACPWAIEALILPGRQLEGR